MVPSTFHFTMLAILEVFSTLAILLPTCLGQDQQKVVSQNDDFATKNAWFHPDNQVYHVVEIEDAYYGRRNLSYFISKTGQAIVDGDVVYGTEEELLSNLYDPNRIVPVAFSVRDFWPDATIKYKYDSDGTQTLLSDTVPLAISRWQAAAPYIKFSQQSPNGVTPQNGVLIISANVGDGCHSDIGYRNAAMYMNLERNSPTSCNCCPDQATHEFGHLLGLNHEHQRPDRESHVNFQCANVSPECSPGSTVPPSQTCCNNPSGCCSKMSNFNIINDAFHDSTFGYDIGSLMHYGQNFFAIDGTNTLVPVAGTVFPPSPPGTPSVQDVQRICKIYRNWCPRAQACAAQGCPSRCVIRPCCPHSPRCLDKTPPSCCDCSDNADCRAEKARCRTQGCDFLL